MFYPSIHFGLSRSFHLICLCVDDLTTAHTFSLPQDAGLAPFPAFEGNLIPLTWVAVWYGLKYSPNGIAANLASTKPVAAAGGVCVQVLRSQILVNRINAAARRFPGSLAAILIIGIAASAGGKLLLDATGLARGPSELSAPGGVLKSAFLGTVTYFGLVHQLRVLSSMEGLGLIVLLFALPDLIGDLTGAALVDITAPVTYVFNLLTNPPWLGGGGRGRTSRGRAAAAAPAKAASASPAPKKKAAAAASRSRSRRRT